ncbi:MAG: lysozyme inhibitor LprI family protein [Rhizobium rhizophilum]|uniref:lysozyme inhibitor LprI family protein n=1 Tax=Rhizobium rhizophilum TaxID=1850373 RepID=UPI00391BFF3F
MSESTAATRALIFALLAAPLLAGAQTAHAASFDCTKPDLAADEQAICQTPALNDMDVKMVTTFDLLSGLLAMGARGSLQDQQIAWLTKRGECGADLDCLTAAYVGRMADLAKVYDGLQRPQ